MGQIGKPLRIIKDEPDRLPLPVIRRPMPEVRKPAKVGASGRL